MNHRWIELADCEVQTQTAQQNLWTAYCDYRRVASDVEKKNQKKKAQVTK